MSLESSASQMESRGAGGGGVTLDRRTSPCGRLGFSVKPGEYAGRGRDGGAELGGEGWQGY